eukprot:PhF_6_TR25497/c1_g2_i4/m.35514
MYKKITQYSPLEEDEPLNTRCKRPGVKSYHRKTLTQTLGTGMRGMLKFLMFFVCFFCEIYQGISRLGAGFKRHAFSALAVKTQVGNAMFLSSAVYALKENWVR